jgi:hypothetical protein
LTAKSPVLPGEDPVAFERFSLLVKIDWVPEGMTETLLVERIAILLWRLRRVPELEAGFIRHEYALASARGIEVSEIPSEAFTGAITRGLIEKLGRYETAIQRKLSWTIRELTALQDRRRKRVRDPEIESSYTHQLRILVQEFKDLEARAKAPWLLLHGSEGPSGNSPESPLAAVHRAEREVHTVPPTVGTSSGSPETAAEDEVESSLPVA